MGRGYGQFLLDGGSGGVGVWLGDGDDNIVAQQPSVCILVNADLLLYISFGIVIPYSKCDLIL